MDDRSGELADRSVLAAARTAVQAEKKAGCQLLEAAAAWADLHPSDSLLTPAERLEWYGEKAILYGGEGTPDVAETAAGTLGAEIGMNPQQARNLISDALDARHRLPGLWHHVRAGRVRRDTVHRVADRTRHLTIEQAGRIDARIAGSLTRLTPGQRLDNLLDAQIRLVDAERLEQQAAAAVHDRYVRQGRPHGAGMADIWFRTTVADATASMSSINQLADLLIARRDDLPAGVAVRGANTKDQWRAVAAHLLTTNPVLAVQLQFQAQQPDLFDQAVSGLTGLRTDPSASAACNTGARPSPPHPPDNDHVGDDHAGDHAGDDVRGGGEEADRLTAVRAIVSELITKIDPAKLQPAAMLHIHICDQALDGPFGPADPQARLARVEGIGPQFLETTRQWLGQACTVKLQPVIDTTTIPSVDRYEFPPALREAILTRSPASVFPWSNSLNRRNDLDHTSPYRSPDNGGPPGQTGIHNGGPVTRREHCYKTFGPIAVRQPEPATHVWKTKYGRVLIVNPSGTFDLGTGNFAHAVWAAVRHCGIQSPVETRVRQLLAAA